MDISKISVKKIRELIVFTAFLVIALWKFDVVLDVLKAIWGIAFPFVLGAVLITVVLTVPGFHLLFKVETLDLMQLGCVYLYAFASLPIIQLLKWIRMKLRKRGER